MRNLAGRRFFEERTQGAPGGHAGCDVLIASAVRLWKGPLIGHGNQGWTVRHGRIWYRVAAGRPLFGGEHCGVGAAVW
jgi:hypothetical protein